MSRLDDSMIRRVEETRAVQLNDYGFHDRNVLYGKLRELRKQKEKKDITEEEKRIIDIQIMRLQNLIDTMDQNAAKRREGEYVDVPEIDVDDKFDTLLDYAISEQAKNHHLEGLISHEKMVSVRNHLRKGD